jgi:hypothetical protein
MYGILGLMEKESGVRRRCWFVQCPMNKNEAGEHQGEMENWNEKKCDATPTNNE